MPRPSNLNIRQFRDALVEHGFAWLGPQVDRYVDLKFPAPGRYLAPVKDARKRILHRETLAFLLAERAGLEAAQDLIRKAHRRRQDVAARIAPTVLPPCRADLTGTAAIAQLSDDFLTRLASAGYVDFSGLIQMGWSASQLKEHAQSARAVADRKQSMVLA